MNKIGISLMALSAALAAGAAAAQSVAPPPSPTPAPPGPAGGDSTSQPQLQEIVVTAQKRSENLQQTPVTVTAVTAKTLALAGVSDEEDLTTVVPALQVTHGGVNAVVFLRGIGNNSGTPGNEPAVSTYVDGVYHPAPAGSIFTLNDVSQIEVLEGPQGTLFGRNATGGVVNIITRDPTSTPVMNGSVSYGNFNTVGATAYIGGGVADNINADVSLVYSNQGNGYGHNVFDGKGAYFNRDFDVRSKWIFTPTSTTQITFIADYDSTRNDEGADYTVTPGTTTNTGVKHAGGFYDIDANFDPEIHTSQGGVQAKIQQDLGWSELTSITSWRDADGYALQNVDGTALPTAKFIYSETEQTTQQEVNIQSHESSPIKWIGGFFFFDDSAGYDPYVQMGTLFGSATGGLSTIDRQQTYSYAGYGQVTAPIFSDDSHVTLGLRYTDDQRSLTASRTAYPAGTPKTLTYPTNFPFSSDSDRLTYKVSLDHSFTRDFMLYGTVSTGFKSGNYNLGTPTQVPTLPETLTAYEVGVKSEWLDRRLRLNVAGYHYDFDNLQVQAYTAAGAVQTNAAAAAYNGADVALDFTPVPSLLFSSAISYVDAHYSSFPAASCVFILPTGKYSGSAPCSVTGNQVALVDPLTASVSGQYTIERSFGTLVAAVNVSYQSGYFFDVQDSLKQNPYTLVGATLTWTAPNKIWNIALYGHNLTGAEYFANRVVTGGIGDVYTAAAPRTFGVRVGFSY